MTRDDQVKQFVCQAISTMYPPHELEKLGPCLQMKAEKLTTGSDWELPPLETFHRVLVVGGIGSIKALERIISNPFIKENVRGFIFIENDPKVIAHLLVEPLFAEMVSLPSFRFLFLHSKDTLGPALFNTLKEPSFSNNMENAAVFFNQEEPNEDYRKLYEQIYYIYNDTLFHVQHNYGQIDDSLIGVEATVNNGHFLQTCPGIGDLEGFFKGRPAAIIGAGPSLDDELKVLKEHQDKFIIIATDAAVKPLLLAGITPEFTTSIERNNKQAPFWEDLPSIETQFVGFPVVHPDVLSVYPGRKRLVYRNYSYFAYFEAAWPRRMLHSGGSSSHLANRLAHFMGCSPIVLVGCDSSYKLLQDGNYQSHCQNTGYPEWADPRPLLEFHTERKHLPAIKVEANDGSEVMTNITYYQWAKEFTEEAMVLGLEGQLFNTAPKGCKVAMVQFNPLSSIAASLDPIPSKKVPYPEPKNNRPWDHTVLASNLTAWNELAKEAVAILNQIDPEVSDPELLSFVWQIHEHKFLEDHMFVSFVIQNCAAEFYKLANRWNALNSDIGVDYKQKVGIMKERFALFTRVLTGLEGIFNVK